MIIITQEIKLDLIAAEHAPELAKYANNPKIAARLTDKFPYPYTIDDAQNFIAFANHFAPKEIFGIFYQENFIGTIGIHPQQDVYRKNAELGYWIAEPYWGKGIITAVIPKMLAYAFETWDINRVYARPFGFNNTSAHVLEKLGFLLEAKIKDAFYKNGKYEDELIYAVRRPAGSL
jgi:RimJ/RimL family protein N-acetyltransferase